MVNIKPPKQTFTNHTYIWFDPDRTPLKHISRIHYATETVYVNKNKVAIGIYKVMRSINYMSITR